MRFLATTAINSKKNKSIPVFIELRTLTTKNNIKILIQRYFEAINVKISDDSFSYLLGSGKIVLLLDGFDETPEECLSDLIYDLEQLKTKYQNLRIIVSSRPGNEIQKSTGFRIVELAPLEKSDYSPFLERLSVPVQKRAEIVGAISVSPGNISGIIKTPLMLTLVLMVYEAEREIPPTLPEFFERLFQVVFTRHDRLKAGFNRKHYSGLSERRLQLLFEAFCFMSLQHGFGRSLSSEQFSTAFDDAVEYTLNCKCEVEKFRLDITKVACLMLEEGLDLVTFLHKSIVEYYAASFIKRSADEVASLFYAEALENFKQWEAVLSFLKEIDAYRYAREYTIKEVTPVLMEIKSIIEGKNKKDIFSFIQKHQPEIGIGFVADINMPGKEDVPRYFGPITPPSAECMQKFPHLITDALERSLPKKITLSEIKGTFHNSVSKSNMIGFENDIIVSYMEISKIFGENELWFAFARFQSDLERKVMSAEEIIKNQEKRRLIFNKK